MKTKYGYMPCLTCGERVVVKENEKGTLGYGCDECGSVSYSRKGEGQYAIWLKKITRVVPPKPDASAPAPAAPKSPKPAAPESTPAGKKPSTYFG